MSNLNGIPSADYFETKLANTWNGTNGTVYVEEVPSGAMPVGEYSYIVVNPGELNMQVAKIDGWDNDNKTFNVTDVVVESGAGTTYTAKTHPLGAVVRFSNNYAFWKDIQTAVNAKQDAGTLSAVATSGDYDDLINKPVLSTVALSNDYNDLDNLPTPISIAVGDKVLQLSAGNELSATISASYNNGTKKITLYGANSAVISEIDCTEFIKDGMIQNVQIVTDPAGYAPGKYLEFDFNTDSGVTDIYIALSDLAVYTAGTGIDITSNVITLKKATTNSLGGVIVGSGLSVNDGTISADSQTDENYTTAEKNKLACIEDNAQVNVIEDVKVNGSSLNICCKAVNVELKTINGEAITGSGDLDIMARQYTAGTGISISCTDEISISTAYQNTINCKANCSDIPTDNCQLNNGCGYIKGISCCDVTTALGYTPYNSNNPNGYTTCTGTLQGGDLKTVNGNCLVGSGDICIQAGVTSVNGCTGAVCLNIPTDNCELGNGCGYTTCTGTLSTCSDITTALGYTPYSNANPNGYTTCTGTLQACDITNLAQCCDIPTNNNQLSNGCGYTTCTGTLVASDLTPYAKNCDLKAVATSGKYCDLTGTPTIPTNNNQLTNGCGYTTCTGTVSSCADIISKLGYTPYNSTNPCGYTTCTGTLTASDLTGYAKSCDLKAVATSGKYCDLTGTPTIPTDNCQLTNGCGYTTCTGTLIPSNIACINGCCLTNGGNICIQGGEDYSWVTKTISGGEVELGLRTIVNTPTSDFTLQVPATIKEGEEYVIRTISETSYCMCLGSCFTNPRNVDTCLSGNATDQYVFLAIGGELELQPLSACG